MNNEQITDIAMLATFLNDEEFTSLASSEEFQSFLLQQKKSITSLLKNSFALSKASMNLNIKTKIETTSSKSKIYIPDTSNEKSETLVVSDSANSPNTLSIKSTDTLEISRKTNINQNDIMSDIVQLFADKTGYPSDMLEPKLDLEADLGIDTVKQMEILGQIRQKYNIRLKEGFSLKQTPNIESIVNLVIAG